MLILKEYLVVYTYVFAFGVLEELLDTLYRQSLKYCKKSYLYHVYLVWSSYKTHF